MGYDIYIGNTTMEEVEQEDDEMITTPYFRCIKGNTIYYRPVVRELSVADAPSFVGDEYTGKGNSRRPGYSSWHNFCEATGLLDLFFHKKTGLMREHPGHASLSSEHLQQIQQAHDAFVRKYPHAHPSYREDDPVENYHLIRLLWLEWWIRYAIEQCEHAAIYNF